MGKLVLAYLLGGVLLGQTPPPAAVSPSNWVGAGAAYTSGAAPPVAGWASYAVLVSGKGQVYSFSSYDVQSARTKPFSVVTTTRTGLATILKQWGPVYVLGFGTAGVAAATNATTGAYSGGGVAIWRISSTDWTLCLGIRIAKNAVLGTQNVYEFGFGRTF